MAGDDSDCGILLEAWLCVLADINGGGKGVCKEWPFNKEKNTLVGKGPKAGILEKEDVIGWSMMETKGTWIVCL